MITINIATKLTAKITLYLISSSRPDNINTILILKANITPIMTNKVAKTPKTFLWTSSFGASYEIYFGIKSINIPTITPCKLLQINNASIVGA